MTERLRDLRDFYGLLDALEAVRGSVVLSAGSGRMNWPARGVYFFFEDGEVRAESGCGPRVVRVGTHALHAGARSSLWSRLAQHRGPARSGGGNHRGSIFRLIVGRALQRRDGLPSSTWGQGSHAPAEVRCQERELEAAVSRFLGAMRVLCLAVPDPAGPESLRGCLERNAIALLSNHERPALDPPGSAWLGRHADRERVRLSGLWNIKHVEERHDPTFLAAFEQAVRAMERDR
jgi:hypothetical protein